MLSSCRNYARSSGPFWRVRLRWQKSRSKLDWEISGGSSSMATTCAFLVPARVLASVSEAAPAGTGRFDDLRLAVFTGREGVPVLRLDLVLVMGSLIRFARRHPPHHLNPTRANDPAGRDPKARLSGSQSPQQRSVCREMPVHCEQDDCS